MTPDEKSRLAVVEQKCGTNEKRLVSIEAKVDAMRLDMHGAKVAGRLFVGVALALASFVGWMAAMLFKVKGP